ncbi:MAG: PA0069 family radical SAM protein [Gammaproteobacteria bacterium]
MNANDEHVLPARPRKGRGAVSNPDGRFESRTHRSIDDGWRSAQDDALDPPKVRTTLTPDNARSILSSNDSPDVGFSLSINPYRGCEHGCVYCFARPSHAYLGLSPGLDFETRLFYKPQAAALLEEELRRPNHRCSPIALGINTDAYQPVERELKISRGILRVLDAFQHPVTIVTKSALVERDLDILAAMAQRNLAQVLFSITTLNSDLSRRLEPRTTAPRRRLEAMRRLSAAGVPVGVMTAPVIPVLTDPELETILEASREAGAESAGYVMLRLPHEVKDLFREWLTHHEPLKADHVMSVIRNLRGGKDYDSAFGTRMRGTGPFAELVAQRFALTCKRLGFDRHRRALDATRFTVPPRAGDQISLF